MKKILLLCLSAIFLLGSSVHSNDNNASDIDKIIKNIPTDSPEYSLSLLYVKKIKTLQFKKEPFKVNDIKDDSTYIKYFHKLATYVDYLSNSKNHIEELTKKMDFLSSYKKPTGQIEYLYYKKLIQIAKEKQKYISDNINIWQKSLYKKLFDIKFDKIKSKEKIDAYLKQLKRLEKQIEQLKIDLEKWKIAEDEKKASLTSKEIDLKLNNKQKIYRNIADNYLIIFFQNIKDKDKEAFKTETLIEKYTPKNTKAYKELLNFYEKERFGNTQLILNKTTDEIKLTFHKIWSILNYPLFSVDSKEISLINFFIFILFIVFGSLIGKYYKKSIYSLKRKHDISNSTITILTNLGYYLILLIAVLLALKSIGLDLSSFTMIAGALSVGIGFGLQNIVSNFVSGIILMFEKSIKIGDYIQLDADTRGTVVDIKMRSITIRTNDNIDLIVPNQNFIQNIVTNWTLSDNSRRFRIPFGVCYGTTVEEVEKTVLEALKKSKFPHYKIGDKKPQVVFTSMGDSSINFELFVWVKGELTLRPRFTTSEVLKIIYKALNDANINIPFPQQDVYIKEFPPLDIKNDK
ncbi:MAG: mechanosensitive ion channel [Epsilonproteobacteria bacterium]|nr:mechanosensitive ion channel [Campylobacterota bacterium]